MSQSQFLEDLLITLPSLREHHCPTQPVYRLLKRQARQEIERLFGADAPAPPQLAPFGMLQFPYFRMGAVDTLNLFDFDELVIFSFYWHNRNRYRRVADLGANLGLHSIILSRCGFEVRSFEPDPTHYGLLKRNLALNACTTVFPTQAAISHETGAREFVRVLGNTTGSHLAGAKASPYGDLERFSVQVVELSPLLQWADLIKMDIEGHEADVLLASKPEEWRHTDAVVEIGTEANARAVFEHFKGSPVNLFAQKSGWNLVKDLKAMPASHRDGSLFLTFEKEMPWEATFTMSQQSSKRQAS
jgi:FkbM family methyltransferase